MYCIHAHIVMWEIIWLHIVINKLLILLHCILYCIHARIVISMITHCNKQAVNNFTRLKCNSFNALMSWQIYFGRIMLLSFIFLIFMSKWADLVQGLCLVYVIISFIIICDEFDRLHYINYGQIVFVCNRLVFLS